jgi:N-acetyltransferase B complex (NatB) non catalytic subunit
MKAMNAGLACRSLLKAATDVTPDPAFAKDPSADPGVPGEVKFKTPGPASKSVETHRELDLVVEVLRYHGKYVDLLAILDDDTRTGVRSRIGNNFSTLKDKIQVLRICKEWKRLWNACDELLRPIFESSEAVPKSSFGKLADDWEVWHAYLEASLQLHKSDSRLMQKAVGLASSACQKDSSQNSLLVLVDLGLRHRDKYLQHARLAIEYIEKYYLLHKSKPYLFRQLRHVQLLSTSHQTRLLSYGRQTSQEQGSESLSSRVSIALAKIGIETHDYSTREEHGYIQRSIR